MSAILNGVTVNHHFEVDNIPNAIQYMHKLCCTGEGGFIPLEPMLKSAYWGWGGGRIGRFLHT